MSKKNVRQPRKIKIKGTNYKIKSRKKFYGFKKANKKLQKEKLFGRIDFNKEMVEVEKLQTKQEKADTVIHEVFHGIIREWPIRVDGRKEERFVRELANGLTEVFKDNPNLLYWILAQLHGT